MYASITLIGFALAAIFKVEAMALIPPITVMVYESLNMMMYSLKMCLKQVAVSTLSISMAVSMQFLIQDWMLLTLIYMPLMFALLKLFVCLSIFGFCLPTRQFDAFTSCLMFDGEFFTGVCICIELIFNRLLLRNLIHSSMGLCCTNI
ncbi:hypothetical protein [Acinetobacter sp. ANC 4173]|uniref:hypothetical protein n=1 Tax=Acinetobacter sp. ANC 4173 TaxID=2529837 RepID=UPI001D0D973E|nr:hypothetical protein [Acinetobacter sp. ANC 4173]